MGKKTFDSLACDATSRAYPDENTASSPVVETLVNTTPVYPATAERAECSEFITLYDRQHIVTYARLLTAEREGVDWRDGVRDILRQDPDSNPEQARICWESHLERAHWISTEGFRLAAEKAKAN